MEGGCQALLLPQAGDRVSAHSQSQVLHTTSGAASPSRQEVLYRSQDLPGSRVQIDISKEARGGARLAAGYPDPAADQESQIGGIGLRRSR